MARKATAFLISLCSLFAIDARAMNGNDWKKLSQGQQQGYIVGVVDTWMNIDQLLSYNPKERTGAVATGFTTLAKCVTQGMTYGQMTAIVQKYIENNPSQWHYTMPSIIEAAFFEVCPPTTK